MGFERGWRRRQQGHGASAGEDQITGSRCRWGQSRHNGEDDHGQKGGAGDGLRATGLLQTGEVFRPAQEQPRVRYADQALGGQVQHGAVAGIEHEGESSDEHRAARDHAEPMRQESATAQGGDHGGNEHRHGERACDPEEDKRVAGDGLGCQRIGRRLAQQSQSCQLAAEEQGQNMLPQYF